MMFPSLALLGLALSSAFVMPQPTPEIRRGDLTFIVRDDQGARVPGITLTLIYDGDGGRLILGDRVTDPAGAATWPSLPFGLYIVQFRGALPSGAAIVPLAEQNLGMLDDGSGTGGGYGIRFVNPVQTELFVLGRVAADARAFPMFDRATSPNAPPDRADPQLLRLPPHDPPTATAGPATPQAAPADYRALALIGGLLWLVAVGILVGWLRSRPAPPREEEKS